MTDLRAEEILKSAIILEKRGKAFYTQIAKNSEEGPVKNFFSALADEEEAHVRYLQKQFAHHLETGDFQFLRLPKENHTNAHAELAKAIGEASYEAAAIGAAILMEEQAIKLYAQRAEEAVSDSEKSLYTYLADWERGHLSDLIMLDKQIKEGIWNDSHFWSF